MDRFSESSKSITVLYHFMHPDDVVSAVHFDGFSQDLAEMGWRVEAISCNRGCRDESKIYPSEETFRGVHYRRVWRPGFSQKAFWGRIANALWMIGAWTTLAFRPQSSRPDVIVIGTDPVFAAAAAIPIRLFAPNIKLVHWCFDMHPEAAIVSGVVSEGNLSVRIVKAIMRLAYRRFDLIADIGVCMRGILHRYEHNAKESELTPWALFEPMQPVECHAHTRRQLFGDAKLGILYSGNFGEAHDFNDFLSLARLVRDNKEIHFCFAVRGNRADELRRAVTPEDRNISFAEFAPVDELERRLGSADIHLVSLRKEFAGIAVPSKFFGSIASGRPVLYAGPRDSAIGQWISENNLGWIIDRDNVSDIAMQMAGLAVDQSGLSDMQAHCHSVYNRRFSRKIVMNAWNSELQSLHR